VDEVNDFAIRRARVMLEGVLSPYVEYYFQFKAENMAVGKPGAKYAYIKLIPIKQLDIYAGVIDVPFTREQSFQSSSSLLLIDRSLATESNNIFTDIGLMINGKLFDNKLSLYLAMVNGAGGFEDGINGWKGTNSSSKDVNTYFDLAGRVEYNPLGKWKNGKEWFKRDFNLTFGAAVYYSLQRDNSSSLGNYSASENFLGLTFDAAINWNIIYLEGGFVYQQADPNVAYGSIGQFESYVGYYSQIGVNLDSKNNALVAFRFDSYEEDPGLTKDDTIRELTLGFTWYIGANGHKIKFQTEGTYQISKGIHSTEPDTLGFIWRNQLSLNI
ncbi:MAG: porin, partial [Spirochaetota bacterium]|nr:porin [Spirochaetota bacterium]